MNQFDFEDAVSNRSAVSQLSSSLFHGTRTGLPAFSATPSACWMRPGVGSSAGTSSLDSAVKVVPPTVVTLSYDSLVGEPAKPPICGARPFAHE